MTDASETAKRTPLYDKHVDLNAKMVDFAGFKMPVMYGSINSEHLLVRNKVGLFDLSHMGEFMVSGSDAETFLQRVTVNDVSALSNRQVQYTCMCYPDGGIVDDFLVYRLDDRFLLVVNAACIDKDFAWLKENVSGDVTLVDDSDNTGLIAIQGPQAQAVLSRLTRYDLESVPFYWAAQAEIGGDTVLFSRTGYTGEDGFELYARPEICGDLWDALMDAGADFGIGPVGLGARDSLRLEMKYMLYGNDIDQKTNPIAAGLGWIVKLDKGEFIGSEPIARMKAGKPPTRLAAFEIEGKAIPRKGYRILKEGDPVGAVSSGGYSPCLEKGIGLGYVSHALAKVGTELAVSIRDKNVPAVVIKPPFYKNGTHK